MLGRFDEAEAEYQVAIKLNPLFPSGHARIGFLCYLRGNNSQAVYHLNESLRLAEDFPEARFALGMVYLHQGDHAAAIEIFSRRLNEMPIAIHIGMLAGAYHRVGKQAECQDMLGRLDRMAAAQYVTPMARVAACVGMGDLEGAMEALAASIEDRAIFANVLNVDPFVDPPQGGPALPPAGCVDEASPAPGSRVPSLISNRTPLSLFGRNAYRFAEQPPFPDLAATGAVSSRALHGCSLPSAPVLSQS